MMSVDCDPGFIERYAGEELAWELQLVDETTGDVEDLTGRPIAATLYRGDGTEIVSMLGTTVPGSDCHAAGVFPGTTTASLHGQAALHLQISEVTEHGRAVHLDRPFRVKRAPATITVPDESGGVGAGGERFTVHRSNKGNRLVVSRRGARGASAAEQLARSIDPDTDEPYIPAPTVPAMVDWMKRLAGDAADLAYDEAAAQAAFAQTQGQYAKAQGDYAKARGDALRSRFDHFPTGTAQTALLRGALAAAAPTGVFDTAPGSYLLDAVDDGALLRLDGLTGFAWHGNGSRLIQVFDPAAQGATARTTLSATNCTDLTLDGLIFAYSSAPTSEGVITYVDPTRITYRADPGRGAGFTTMDYFNVADQDTGKWYKHQYAQSESDYAPEGTYPIGPESGQALGEDGDYGFSPPAQSAVVTAIAQLSPFRITAPAHGFASGTNVTISGLVDGVGDPLYPGLAMLVTVIDPDTIELSWDEESSIDLTGLGASLAPGASIAKVRIPAGVRVGDRVQIFWRKRDNPLTLFTFCRNVRLDFRIEHSVSVCVRGNGVENLHVDLICKGPGSIAGTAGGIVLNGVSGTFSSDTIYAEGLGDDLINLPAVFWGRGMAGAPVAGDTTVTVQFAVLATQLALPIVPKKDALIEVWDPSTMTIAKTLKVVSAVPVVGGRDGDHQVVFDSALPPGFTTAWPMINRSAVARWRLGDVTLIGCTARALLAQTHDLYCRRLVGIGLYSSIIRAQMPASGLHILSGGAKGNHRYDSVTAINCGAVFNGVSPGVIVLRRFVPPKSPPPGPTEWLYDFGRVVITGYDYGGIIVTGFNATFEYLKLAGGGLKRATDPRTSRGQDTPANFDLWIESGTVTILDDDLPADAKIRVVPPYGKLIFKNRLRYLKVVTDDAPATLDAARSSTFVLAANLSVDRAVLLTTTTLQSGDAVEVIYKGGGGLSLGRAVLTDSSGAELGAIPVGSRALFRSDGTPALITSSIGPISTLVSPTAPSFGFAGGVLPAGVTVARASARAYTDATGASQLAAADAAAFDSVYNPATGVYQAGGLIVAPAVTNLVPKSDDMTALGSPTGVSLSATRLIEDTSTGLHFAQLPLSLAAATTYLAQAEVSLAPGSAPRCLALYWMGAVLPQNQTGVVLDLQTGQVSARGGPAAFGAIQTGPGRWKLWFTVATTAAGTPSLRVRLLPTLSSALGTAYAGDGVSGARVGRLSVSRNAGPVPWVPTTGVPVTHAAELVTLPWGALGVSDGAATIRYTFFDGTTQDAAAVIVGGTSAIPTGLAKATIYKVERL